MHIASRLCPTGRPQKKTIRGSGSRWTKRRVAAFAIVSLLACLFFLTRGDAHEEFDVEANSNGEYAPGQENTSHRDPSVDRMMQQTPNGRDGSSVRQRIAERTSASGMWWPSVSVKNLNRRINGYPAGEEDATDAQFGAVQYKSSPSTSGHYHHIAAGENMPSGGCRDTGVSRVADGRVPSRTRRPDADGQVSNSSSTGSNPAAPQSDESGTSQQDDYADLGAPGLYAQFNPPLSTWGDNKPPTVWNDVEYGSAYDGLAPAPELSPAPELAPAPGLGSVPEPASMLVWGLLATVAVAAGSITRIFRQRPLRNRSR